MINLNELDKVVYKKNSFFQQLKDFIVVFIVVLSFGWLFINAQLVFILFDNLFHTSVAASDIVMVSPSTSVKINKVQKLQSKDEGDDLSDLKRKILEKQLNKKLSKFSATKTDMIYKPSYKVLIRNNLLSYSIKFNTLPPDARIIIPKLDINVHIVNLTNIPIEKIKKADYDEYLYSWVVKYPYTADPGQTWNVFIFGHSSYYWWKHNPYGSVFAKLPSLRHWDLIQISWNWKIYTYRIFKKLILYPREVEYSYKRYRKGQYLTLMTCYPVWSDRQRMLVIAELIK